MIETFFDDPRHRRSEELAFEAEHAERSGDLDTAARKYAEAASLEEDNALAVPADAPRVRGLLAVSAVALWLRAERWDDAARAGCTFLARPDLLTSGGRTELQSLIDRAWRASEVERTIGADGVYVPLEARLSGGLVRTGLAPSTVVAERRDVLTPLLIRVAEWRSNRKYRKGGPSALASSYQFLEAPALASSYALRLYVAAGNQPAPDEAAASPHDVVDYFLRFAKIVAEGSEALRDLVGDDAYTQAFLRGFRDLAPDGRAVGRVDLGAIVRGRLSMAAALMPETRVRLTEALRMPDREAIIEQDGVLKFVNLRGAEPRIGVDTDSGAQVFRIAKGEHDDTIGAKLNRRVRVQGMRRVSEAGEADNWADDIIVLDEDSMGTGAAPTPL
jgi:hypothetical protein